MCWHHDEIPCIKRPREAIIRQMLANGILFIFVAFLVNSTEHVYLLGDDDYAQHSAPMAAVEKDKVDDVAATTEHNTTSTALY